MKHSRLKALTERSMGLGMYAVRKLYTKQWEHESPDERYSVQIERGGKPVAGIQSDRISAVEEEVMRWNKANHIHGWFVDNVQGGIDDCKQYLVEDDDLRKLVAVCKKIERTAMNGSIDKALARKLLPTRYQFSHGFVQYDDRYLSTVIATGEWAARMLAQSDAGVPGEIYYSSSW